MTNNFDDLKLSLRVSTRISNEWFETRQGHPPQVFLRDDPGRSRNVPSLIVHLPMSNTGEETNARSQPAIFDQFVGTRKIQFARLPIGSLDYIC